jgi:23S rRNA (uracil1939-C5)-methyltransferase
LTSRFASSPRSKGSSTRTPIETSATPVSEVRVQITGLSNDGRGVAKLPDGKVLFVKGALPQEEVSVKITQNKKSFAQGDMSDLHVSSPMRTMPPCPVFGVCGGCQLQHLKPNEHGSLKKKWLFETLTRVGKWPQSSLEVAEKTCTLVEGKSLRYRQRVRLHVRPSGIGFMQEGSHDVVSATQCLLPSSTLWEHWRQIHATLELWQSKNQDKAKVFLEVEATDVENGQIAFELILNERSHVSKGALADLRSKLAALPFAFTGPEFTKPHPFLQHIHLHRQSFLQPHVDGMKEYCDEISRSVKLFLLKHKSALQKSRKLISWDLYAGSGVFTGISENEGKSCGLPFESLGVEGVGPAIASLQKNYQHWNVKGLAKDVDNFVSSQQAKINSMPLPHIVILDPPRTGAGLQTIEKILDVLSHQQDPTLIVYVACDAASLARDSALILQAGYQLSSLCVFDMFAQTVHFETIATFSKDPTL